MEHINIISAYLLLAIFSLTIGSFLNVLIYRLPIMLRSEWVNECKTLLRLPLKTGKTINLFFPRSFCPSCNTTISAWDNIPILSYCILHGSCRQCKSHISLRYPAVEALTCLLSLLAAASFGFNPSLVFVLLFIWIIISLFFIDLETQLLPDSLTITLLWIGLIANTQALFVRLPNAVISAACAYLTLWLIIKLFYLITGKIGMGNGDFKLYAAFGAWFGAIQLPIILLISSISGLIIGTVYLITQKKNKDTPIPFGPFLCVSGLITLFSGQKIIHYYLAII